MNLAPRVKFYLVHLETGQRYPVGDRDVIIGRSSGDLLFPDDGKLAGQHCCIVMTPSGLGIHDLGSGSATVVEGKAISPEKVYMLRSGYTVNVGAQEFRVQEVNPERKRRRRLRTKERQRLIQAAVFILGTAVIYAGGLMVGELRRDKTAETPPIAVEPPFAMVEKEMQAAFDQYRELGERRANGTLTDKQMMWNIRKLLLPDLNKVHGKLGVLKAQTEFERRKIKLTRDLVAALIGQVTAMADQVETKSQDANRRLALFSQRVHELNAQVQYFKRNPAQVQ